jgi:hypothetical protein
MTTIVKIKIDDDFTDQHLSIKHQLGGTGIEFYLEVFAAALLVAGFDQKLVNQKLGLE